MFREDIMDYQKIYSAICKRGQERILPEEVYTEKHHIVPKCLGGGNEKSNLTVLTAREHFICHLILARKLYPKNPKLWNALHCMMYVVRDNITRYVPSGRVFEEINFEKSNISKIWRQQYPQIGEQNPMFGKTHSEETKNKLSIIQKNSWTAERKECLSKRLKGKKRSMACLNKPVVQLDLEDNVINRWNSLKEIKEILNFDSGQISLVCRGLKRMYKRYKWKFKKDYDKIQYLDL